MDQDFVDRSLGEFDRYPELARGCSGLIACGVFILYKLVFNGGFDKVSPAITENNSTRVLPVYYEITRRLQLTGQLIERLLLRHL
jgi:hypothetical protein